MSEIKVDTKIAAVVSMEEDWRVVESLWGGTKEMRKQGEKFLPKRAMEQPEDYEKRLARATLYPAFSETVKALTGRVFAKPVTVSEDTASWIKEEVFEDVDRAGNKLDVFAKDVFEIALRKGHCCVLVESPKTNTEDGKALTVQQQKAGKIRPYGIIIDPKRILGWIEEDGKLVQVRIKFYRYERQAFGVSEIEQIRVIEPGKQTIFERASANEQYQQKEVRPIGITDQIPLVTYYTKRTGTLQSSPPLLELAFLNTKHWAQQSSNDELVETASVPILALINVDGGDTVTIGARSALKLPAGSDAKYIEHTGAAIQAGRDSLSNLKEEMREAGAKLLQPQSKTTKTVNQANEDNARENSMLAQMAQGMDDFLANLSAMIGAWRSDTNTGTITTNPNLEFDPDPAATMKVVLDLRREGLLDDENAFKEAQRRGLISDELDWEDVQIKVETKKPVVDFGADPNADPNADPSKPNSDNPDNEGQPPPKNEPAPKTGGKE